MWKAFVRFRAQRPDLEMCVVDTDFGCGVVRHGEQALLNVDVESDLEYSNFDTNRKEWLNLITTEEFLERHS